jgi:hypothetical protein
MNISAPIKEKIKQDAIAHARELKIEQTANLHFFTEALEAGQKLRAGPIETEIKTKTAIVLVDLMPTYNWAHPAKVLLYDAEKGQLYKTLDTRFPPTVMENQPSKVEAISTPVKMLDTQKDRIVRVTPGLFPKTSLVKRYAILFSGNSNNRHLNDLEFLYRTLTEGYGFEAQDIYTLNYNGTLSYQGASNPIGNWPGDNSPYRLTGHINGAGTRDAMEAALDQISAKIKSSDMLFIHTNDHGAGPGDGVDDFCLNAYSQGGWSPYYVTDFVNKLKSLPKFDKLMVMMEQCRSGGFVTPIIDNSPANWTHVSAAVRASNYSLGGINFDPFAEDWIAAMNGHYQSGATLIQNAATPTGERISAIAAFNYANAVHHYGDTPTSADKPEGYGSYIFLGLTKNDPIIARRIPSEQVIQLIRKPIPELKKEIIGPNVSSKIQR